jgi:carboxylesterase type B
VLSNILNSSVTAQASFSIVIDHDFIIGTGTNLTLNGQFVKVPYLLGTNHDEGTAFAPSGINTTEEFLAVVTSNPLTHTVVDNATAAIVAVVYPDIPEIGIPDTLVGRPPESREFGRQSKRAAAYFGDMLMQGPRRISAQSWAKYNGTAYTYIFDIIPNGLNNYIGATHFQEVAFVFHNIAGDGYNNSVAVPPFEGMPESYIQAATLMSRSWVSFIVNGDPNYSGGELFILRALCSFFGGFQEQTILYLIVADCLSFIVNFVKWPVYTLDAPQNIVFNANVTGLAYLERDTFRAEAIAYLSETVLQN